jgi:hypothetical protein
MTDAPPSICSLCDREVPPHLLTLHHLTPKQKGGKAEDRAPMCRPCHKQLHALFSNTQLAREYASLEALKAAPQLAPFLKWIRKQKCDRNFRTVKANSHPRRRRKGY